MVNVPNFFNLLVEVDVAMSENVDSRIEPPDLKIQRRPITGSQSAPRFLLNSALATSGFQISVLFGN